jgi:hypothetical protein
MVCLDDAMRDGSVSIREDAGVSGLKVKNRSAKDIFIAAGEIVLGGRQDRVVSTDVFVMAGQEMPLPVFCVEHGRWSGGDQFGSAFKMANPELRKIIYLEQNQGRVWSQVASQLNALGAQNPSGALREAFNSKDFNAAIARYRAKLQGSLPKDTEVVGIAVAILGQLTYAEVFADGAMFRKMFEKILPSLVLEAVVRSKGATATGPFKANSVENVSAFLSGIFDTKCVKSGDNQTFDTYTLTGDELGARAMGRRGQVLHLVMYPSLTAPAKANESAPKVEAGFDLCARSLASSDEATRLMAVHGIASFKNDQVLKLLCDRLADQSDNVKLAAANALAERGDRGAVRPLCQALDVKQKDDRIQMAFINSIARLGGDEGVEPVVKLIYNNSLQGHVIGILPELFRGAATREVFEEQFIKVVVFAETVYSGLNRPADTQEGQSARRLEQPVTESLKGIIGAESVPRDIRTWWKTNKKNFLDTRFGPER